MPEVVGGFVPAVSSSVSPARTLPPVLTTSRGHLYELRVIADEWARGPLGDPTSLSPPPVVGDCLHGALLRWDVSYKADFLPKFGHMGLALELSGRSGWPVNELGYAAGVA